MFAIGALILLIVCALAGTNGNIDYGSDPKHNSPHDVDEILR